MVTGETLVSHGEALDWLQDVADEPHGLLGNGFSMAYDADSFAYGALVDHADVTGHMSVDSKLLMRALGTTDFERAMRVAAAAYDVLGALGAPSPSRERVGRIVSDLREALAQAVAGLHPERPMEISEAQYISVRRFLAPLKRIYTLNYDLLLYWAIMQDIPDGEMVHTSRRDDDGFRAVDDDSPTVVYNVFDPFDQTIYYLHGALHLYEGDGELHKLTYSRTAIALIDQVREQLEQRRYPLYVSEGTAEDKSDRILRSAYLGRGMRSLSTIRGGILVYGHAMAASDDHVLEALSRSKVERMAVSIYGDPSSDANRAVAHAARGVSARRRAFHPHINLDLTFYDAESARLWV